MSYKHFVYVIYYLNGERHVVVYVYVYLTLVAIIVSRAKTHRACLIFWLSCNYLVNG
jgi:hypothetical protein